MVEQKNIALWSHPRSMSTTVERYFRERGDCECHHEPFMYYYYVKKNGKLYPGFEPENDRPCDLDAIAKMVSRPLANEPQVHHIFFKDMSYYITEHLEHLQDVMKNLVSIFLIRDPRLSFASYGKLDSNFSREEGGLKAQWQHYDFLKKKGQNPIVIDAATIMSSPQKAMKLICDFAGIAFIEDALTWSADQKPADWEQAKTWHAGVINSTGFSPPQKINADKVFQDAVSALPKLQDYLDYHEPYYQRLKQDEIVI